MRGTVVYRRYASISARTNATSECAAARIQRSIAFGEDMARRTSGAKRPSAPSASSSRLADWTKKRKLLYHGRKTSRITPFTPLSLNLSVSAHTTGELIR